MVAAVAAVMAEMKTAVMPLVVKTVGMPETVMAASVSLLTGTPPGVRI